jgi:hypothetical protein
MYEENNRAAICAIIWSSTEHLMQTQIANKAGTEVGNYTTSFSCSKSTCGRAVTGGARRRHSGKEANNTSWCDQMHAISQCLAAQQAPQPAVIVITSVNRGPGHRLPPPAPFLAKPCHAVLSPRIHFFKAMP